MTPALGVYAHWPYCARICPYCDFNVRKNREVDADRWARALEADLAYWAQRTAKRPLTSLYFGGGTPSLAPVSVIEAVIDACEKLWGFEEGAEITLEANPTDAESARFETLASVGINRLSLGVQAFEDEALRFLGRNHDGAAARAALDAAMAAFPRVSFDLIYALPGETPEGWRRRLEDALKRGAGHLSVYQLTIEPGTAFAAAVARGSWSPPDDALAADLFDIAQETTAAAGLPAYETSNHARPGEESRHNLLYWRYQDYIGVGPGAHGRLTGGGGHRIATETPHAPEAYLAMAEQGGARATETLDEEAQLIERLGMGLRLREGVPLGEADLRRLAPRIAPLEADGLVSFKNGRLRAVGDGPRLLDSVLASLLA